MSENQNNGGEDGNNGDDNKKLYEGESIKGSMPGFWLPPEIDGKDEKLEKVHISLII